MANTIKVKRSSTSAATPSLVFGELGYNSADSKLFVGNASNIAVQIIAGTNTGDQTAASLGLTIGTNVQAYDAGLQSLAAIATTGGDRLIYATATDVYATATFTSFARTLVDDSSAQAALTTLGIGKIASTLAGGRLTLQTAVGVPTTDQTAKTTLYYTPFTHGMIGIYDGNVTKWMPREFSELSLALGTLVSGKNYDVFIGDTTGSLVIEIVVWTSDSARATALLAIDGVWCKSGDPAVNPDVRRYVGTFRTTSTTTTEDSEAKRFVYNANNQAPKHSLGVLGYVDDNAASSFTFVSLNTYAPLNGGTGNKCEWVNGLASTVNISAAAFASAGTSSYIIISVGIDSTTTGNFYVCENETSGGSAFTRGCSKPSMFSPGYHYVSLNAYTSGGTATIYRDDSRAGGTVDSIRTWITSHQDM